jgi:hypothetical protein
MKSNKIKDIYNQINGLSKTGTKKEYLTYIKKIFPYSKFKKIVYHHSDKKIEKFKDYFIAGYAARHGVSKKAIFFLKKPVKKEFLSQRKYLNYCLINLKNPFIYRSKFKQGTKQAKIHTGIKEGIKYALKKNYDGVIFNKIWDNKQWCTVLVIFSSKQSHILGSKKDIKEFKEYLSKRITSKIFLDKFI